MFGLSPDDIDWLRKIIHVRRQVKIVGGRRVFAPPKFGKDRLRDGVDVRTLAEYLGHSDPLSRSGCTAT